MDNKQEEKTEEEKVNEYRKELDELHQKLLTHILKAPSSIPKRYKEYAYSNVEASKMMVVKGSFTKNDVEF